MLDCLGRELCVGDKVVCADGYYSDLLVGEIIKLTPQKIKVYCTRASNMKQEPFETIKYPYQVCKV